MDEEYIEILDDSGNPITVFRNAALEILKQRVAREDRDIGLHRKQIPAAIFTLPDVPEAEPYNRLGNAIERLSTFSVSAINPDQALMMRCIRCYWNAKAVAFPNLIHNIVPDPTADGGVFSQTIPRRALERLRLDLAAEKAFYDLLNYDLNHPQQSDIRIWLQEQKIDYPFANHEDYFLAVLSARFQLDYQAPLYVSEATRDPKHEVRRFHRQCLKYLSNLYDPRANKREIRESEESLRKAKWEGYALLALRTSPKQRTCKTLKRLWSQYIKTQRAGLKRLDADLHWKNSLPHQCKKTNDSRPLKGVLTDEGYIDWVWG